MFRRDLSTIPVERIFDLLNYYNFLYVNFDFIIYLKLKLLVILLELQKYLSKLSKGILINYLIFLILSDETHSFHSSS